MKFTEVERRCASWSGVLSPAVVFLCEQMLAGAAALRADGALKASSVCSELQNEIRVSGDKTQIEAGYAKESYNKNKNDGDDQNFQLWFKWFLFLTVKEKAQNVQGAAAFHLSNLPQQRSSSFCKCDTRAGSTRRGGGPCYVVLGRKAIRSAFSEARTLGYILW